MTNAPARHLAHLLLCSLIFSSSAILANQAVISSDGREVLLKKDGSWIYRSNDRFANTADGRRVRLKADGSWEYSGHAPLVSKEQVRTTELGIRLQKIVIEAHEKKVLKNTRVKTQTVFYLNLEASPRLKHDIEIRERDISLIEVLDNNGKSYPILSIQPNSTVLKPGAHVSIAIRADKSPAFWANVKSIKIVLNPGIFGLKKAVSFEQKVANIDTENVEGFK